MMGRRGLRGDAVIGEHGGVALDGDAGRCRGDCGQDGLVAPETGSPRTICLRFARSTLWVSGSLNHRKNNSSTFSFNTGFSAMVTKSLRQRLIHVLTSYLNVFYWTFISSVSLSCNGPEFMYHKAGSVLWKDGRYVSLCFTSVSDISASFFCTLTFLHLQ